MQIDLLLKEVEKFLVARLSAAEVFAAYDLFKFLNIKAGLHECKNKVYQTYIYLKCATKFKI